MSDAEEFDVPDAPQPQDRIDHLHSMLEEAVQMQEAVERMEEDLKVAKAALQDLKTKKIPDLMTDLRMERINFRGWDVSVAEEVYGALPKDQERRAEALRWLEEHEGGSIIQTQVALNFGRAQHNEAMDAVGTLRSMGFSPEVGSDVHHSTLKAFVRERLRAGEEVPDRTLGVSVIKAAKLKKVG